MRIFLCLLCFTHNLTAQFRFEKDIVMPVTESLRYPGVVTLGEDGLVIFRENTPANTFSKRIWQVVFFDKDLEFSWDSGFESGINFKISSVKYTIGFVYLLFQDTNYPMKSIFFVRCNLAEKSVNFFRISEFLPAELIDFETLGNSLFLIGLNQKRPTVLKFNFGDPRPVVLKGLFDEENEILHTSVNHDLAYIQIVSRMKKAGKHVILIRKFDQGGENIRDILLESSKGYHFNHAVAHTDSFGNTAVVGVFGYKRSKTSNGVFTGVFREGRSDQMFYYDYVNLHNYFNFIDNERSKTKMQQKYAKHTKGTSYEVNHVPRSVCQVNGNWHFIGEVLHTTERPVNHNRNGYHNAQVTKYSHAILLGLDADGKVKWDHTFSMNELSLLSDQQQAFLYSAGPEPIAFYTDGSKMYHQIFDNILDHGATGETEFESAHFSINSNNLQREGYILPWYGNVFITFGKNTMYSALAPPRYSFYVQKFSVIDGLPK